MSDEFLKEFAARYYELEAEGVLPMGICETMITELDCGRSSYGNYLRAARAKGFVKNSYLDMRDAHNKRQKGKSKPKPDSLRKVTKEPIITTEKEVDEIPVLSEYEEKVIVDLSESKYIVDKHVSQEPSITTPNHISYADTDHTKTETPKVKKKQSWVARLLAKLFGKK